MSILFTGIPVALVDCQVTIVRLHCLSLCREQEITQLKSWQTNVNRLISRFEAALGQAEANSDPAECTSKFADQVQAAGESALIPLRQTFSRDFKKQLYSDQDDREFFDRIKSELKQVERRLEDGAVVLQHLEMFLINVACDDPGRLFRKAVKG